MGKPEFQVKAKGRELRFLTDLDEIEDCRFGDYVSGFEGLEFVGSAFQPSWVCPYLYISK